MAQVTIYMDNALEANVKQLANDTGVSISKFISKILEQNINNKWSKDIKDLSGSWNDIDEKDIKNYQVQDIKREEF